MIRELFRIDADDDEAMKTLELLRHAPRDPEADRLSPAGRARAEDVGRSRGGGDPYVAVFVSPARRAAETAAWFLRGAHLPLPEHAVVPGLGGEGAEGGSPEAMAALVRSLLGQMPDGRAMAISHTPFVERAAFGLTGEEVEPMRECEGILVAADDEGAITVTELRLSFD
jgi:phosphohistidine phosphatase SixA